MPTPGSMPTAIPVSPSPVRQPPVPCVEFPPFAFRQASNPRSETPLQSIVPVLPESDFRLGMGWDVARGRFTGSLLGVIPTEEIRARMLAKFIDATNDFTPVWNRIKETYGQKIVELPPPTEKILRIQKLMPSLESNAQQRFAATLTSILLDEPLGYFEKWLPSTPSDFRRLDTGIVTPPSFAMLVTTNNIETHFGRGDLIFTFIQPSTGRTLLYRLEANSSATVYLQGGCAARLDYPDAYRVAINEEIETWFSRTFYAIGKTYNLEIPDKASAIQLFNALSQL